MSKRKKIINIAALCLLAAIAVGAFMMARLARDRAAALAEESIKVPPAEQAAEEPIQIPAAEQAAEEPVIESSMIGNGVEKKTVDGKDYYVYREDYSGEYDIQKHDYDIPEFDPETDGEYYHYPDALNAVLQDGDAAVQMDYQTYLDFCQSCELDRAYDDPAKHYIVIVVEASNLPQLAAVDDQDDAVTVYMDSDWHEALLGRVHVCVIPTDKVYETVNVHDLYTDEEFSNLIRYGTTWEPGYEPPAEKPVIYLYPEAETDVTVTLRHPECITHSYPKYDGPWHVSAKPDGTLTDQETGRQLYSLYYENVSPIPLLQTGEGFVVRGEDTTDFLEEKLAVLGLSERETEEFIIYWLPRLEENEWNYIRFASREEIDAEMPLEISPEPDSVIRVLMLCKPLDAPVTVTEQSLTTPERSGFTAVEWGGMELN